MEVSRPRRSSFLLHRRARGFARGGRLEDYWLSPEVASGPEVAAILTKVLGQEVRCDVRTPEDFQAFLDASNILIESWYAAGVVEFMRRVFDGRMVYIGTIRDDGPFVTERQCRAKRGGGPKAGQLQVSVCLVHLCQNLTGHAAEIIVLCNDPLIMGSCMPGEASGLTWEECS